MRPRSIALLPFVLVLGVTFSACSATPSPGPSVAPTESVAPTVSPTPTTIARTFTMPTDCVVMVPESREQAFAAAGMSLLGGPGGLYEEYYSEPTPEERAGGMSCIWGDEDVPESTITLSVAPLNASSRSAVIDDLISQGLNELIFDDGISYGLLGDENSAPAILNIVRNDSWISVIGAEGGEKVFNEAVLIAQDIADEVYR